MNRLLPILTIVGAAGFFSSLGLYVLTFFNVDATATPLYGPLTFVLYVTWFLAVLKLIRDPEVKEHQKSKSRNPVLFFKIIFKGTPIWIQAIAGASFIFSMISFAYLMYNYPGVVDIIDGKKVLHNHGDVIKELTDEEYIKALATESRRMVGHYLPFFAISHPLS